MQRLSESLAALLAMQRALDSRLESDWLRSGTSGLGGYPPVNIFQQGDDFVAVIELPGADKETLSVEAKERTIRISGQKNAGYDETASIHRQERLSGRFDRSLTFPVQIDVDAIRAEYKDGILALSIARSAIEKPKTIKIS